MSYRNKEDQTAYSRKWQSENREKCNKASKKWRDANKEKQRMLCRNWHSKNSEIVNAKKRLARVSMSPEEKEKLLIKNRESDNLRNENPKRNEQHYKSYIKRHYNLTLEQYAEMVEAQDNVCFICKQPETFVNYKSKTVVRLAVDHNHDTGEIRKLLCRRCNNVLGTIGEDTSLLQAMIDYLKQHQTALKVVA